MATAAPSAPLGAVAPSGRKVALTTKLSYGFGSIAYGIKDNGFSTLLLLFYNQVVGLPANMVGLAIMIALILDAFIDPMVGHFSDHTKSKWGRRHPYMYAAAIPVGALYLLLWNPPEGSQTLQLAYLVGVAILVRTAISFYEVPSSALAPELTSDYHERTSILGYRFLFGWIGGMTMLLLTFIVFLAPTAEYPIGQLNPEGYKTYAIVAAIAMTVAILVSARGTHKEIAKLPKPVIKETKLSDTFRQIVGTLKNKAFLILTLSGIFTFTNQGLNFALSTYFNTYLWGFPASSLGIFTVIVLLGVAFAFAISTPAAKIWGKRGAAVRFSLAYIVFAIAPLQLRLHDMFPANDSPMLMPLLMAFVIVATGLGVGGAILGSSMMADVVEEAQAKSGERSEGTFFAGSFFMQKCVSGFGLFLSGAILTAVAFPTGATPGNVEPSVIYNLVNTYCILKVILGVIGVAILSRFPISQADHEARVAQLAADAEAAHALPD